MLMNLKNLMKKKAGELKFSINTHGGHKLVNRAKGSDYGCVILAGYKEVLWDTVFPRIKLFAPDDIDICVVSSGLYSEKLDEICSEYGWSYLSVNRNNLCLAQNLAIEALPKAKYFYKLDEDMFVTKEFFPAMKETFDYVKEEGLYNPGFIAPLIPINGYGYIQLLKKWNLVKAYEQKFGKISYTGGNNDAANFTKNPDIPVWFWNEVPQMHDIDAASNSLAGENFQYSVCPFRFSIGAIFFERKLWEEMGAFDVNHTTGMALDEIKLCSYCNTNSLAVIVSENCIVGHLAYGPQMHAMIEFYKNNKNIFAVK